MVNDPANDPWRKLSGAKFSALWLGIGVLIVGLIVLVYSWKGMDETSTSSPLSQERQEIQDSQRADEELEAPMDIGEPEPAIVQGDDSRAKDPESSATEEPELEPYQITESPYHEEFDAVIGTANTDGAQPAEAALAEIEQKVGARVKVYAEVKRVYPGGLLTIDQDGAIGFDEILVIAESPEVLGVRDGMRVVVEGELQPVEETVLRQFLGNEPSMDEIVDEHADQIAIIVAEEGNLAE